VESKGRDRGPYVLNLENYEKSRLLLVRGPSPLNFTGRGFAVEKEKRSKGRTDVGETRDQEDYASSSEVWELFLDGRIVNGPLEKIRLGAISCFKHVEKEAMLVERKRRISTKELDNAGGTEGGGPVKRCFGRTGLGVRVDLSAGAGQNAWGEWEDEDYVDQYIEAIDLVGMEIMPSADVDHVKPE